VKVEVYEGDVIFKRAHNGWIIQKIMTEEFVETYVVEDVSDDPSERIWQVLREVWDDESR
jgi:hypothetical protein